MAGLDRFFTMEVIQASAAKATRHGRYIEWKTQGIAEVPNRGVLLPTRNAVIRSLAGLHARAAAEFVRAVIDSGFPVMISKTGTPGADARSLLEVMAADFRYGCKIRLDIEAATLNSTGAAEAGQVLIQLATLLESPQAPAERSRPRRAAVTAPAVATGFPAADRLE